MNKLNINPKGIKAGDCVIRAIAVTTEQTWDKVYADLCEIGFKMKRMPNEKSVYEKYLNNLGWIKHKQPRTILNSKLTILEFIEYQIERKAIISVANHLTCVDNFELIDTWDCSHKCISNYWTKED